MSVEWKRRIAMAGIVIGVYAAFRWLLPVSIPFLLAWLLAELFYPLALKTERKIKIKKTITGTVLLGLCMVVIIGLLYLGIRELLEQIQRVFQQFPAIRAWAGGLLDDGCSMLEEVTGIQAAVSREYILTRVTTVKEDVMSLVTPKLFGGILSGAKGMIMLISGVVVTFISYVLLLGDMDGIRKTIREYSWLGGMWRVWDRLKKTSVTYLKAQVIIIIAVAIVCSIGFWLMGSPYFLIFGIVLGILDAFPIIGTGAFLYPAAVIMLLRGEIMIAAGCVVLDVITSVLREILEPRLLGERLGIPAIFILISVYAGVFLYGGAGVILGPLSFSAMYEIGKEWNVWGP